MRFPTTINKKGGNGHKTESADLNQDQKHDLTEQGQAYPDVDHAETGYAHGGGCGEERVEKSQSCGPPQRWEASEEPRCQNDAKKAQDKNLPGPYFSAVFLYQGCVAEAAHRPPSSFPETSPVEPPFRPVQETLCPELFFR